MNADEFKAMWNGDDYKPDGWYMPERDERDGGGLCLLILLGWAFLAALIVWVVWR